VTEAHSTVIVGRGDDVCGGGGGGIESVVASEDGYTGRNMGMGEKTRCLGQPAGDEEELEKQHYTLHELHIGRA